MIQTQVEPPQRDLEGDRLRREDKSGAVEVSEGKT